MVDELVVVGDLKPVYTKTGKLSGYRVGLQHRGLHEYKLICGPENYVVQSKITSQIAAWNQKWETICARQQAERARSKNIGTANILTCRATETLDASRNLLSSSLTTKHRVNWSRMESHAAFSFDHGNRYSRVEFGSTGRPLKAQHEEVPPEPNERDWAPKLGFMDHVFRGRRDKRIAEAHARYTGAREQWSRECDAIRDRNGIADAALVAATEEFEDAKAKFEADQAATNAKVAALKAAYEAREASAVATVAELILAASRYPDWLERDSATEYSPESSTLIVDFVLPKIDMLPTVSKVAYIASKNELRTTHITDTERSRLYDLVLYQIVLRSIHEIFSGDTGEIENIVFNGWLTWVNQGTGVEETGCLLSLQVSRTEWLRIDLSKVEPKACFKQLKGVSAAKLSGITPVAPIARMSTEDPRFIDSYPVTERLAEGVNLAAIDWEDFEHLVRELFEQEFASGGGEVKVTRASADGGVDAVAFDPDPIRGGKIVIQAKRYTILVPVSAVRDLYGTMMNEGAMKGILVTTSDYGPDSYTFAKDKPITLLNGGNLLQLMDRHGHKARIDLAEARRLREGA